MLPSLFISLTDSIAGRLVSHTSRTVSLRARLLAKAEKAVSSVHFCSNGKSAGSLGRVKRLGIR
jgi:hypothetical protein